MGFNCLFIFPLCYVALCASKARHRLGSESVSWCLETSLSLRLPSRDGAPSLPLLSLFLSFIFFPTSFWRQWVAFLGAWCPLPAFRSCFVEFTRCLNALLMNLWGRKCSPRPTPPPSWLLLPVQPSFYLKDTLLACLLFLTSFPPRLTGFFRECFLNRSFYSNQWLRLYFWKNLFLRCPYNYKGEPGLIHIGILPGWQWTAVIVSRLELSSAPIFCSHLTYFWLIKSSSEFA